MRRYRDAGGAEGSIELAEYAALLRAVATTVPNGDMPSAADVAEATERLQVIHRQTHAHYSTNGSPGPGDVTVTPEQRRQARVRSAGLSIRNPGELDVWHGVLDDLVQSTDVDVADGLGFSLKTGFILISRMNSIVLTRADQALHLAREQYDAGRQAFRRAKRADAQSTKQRGRDVKRRLLGEAWDQIVASAGPVISFTADELACEGCSAAEVSRFVDAFSVPVGGIDEQYALLPSPLNGLIRTPILVDDLGLYLPNPALLYWAFLPRISELLGSEPETALSHKAPLHRFERGMARFLERRVGKLLTSRDVSNVLTGAHYPISQGEAEVDNIGILDRSLVICECKATHFSRPALRGGLKSLDSEITHSVVEGQRQAERAHAAADTAIFSAGRKHVDFGGQFDEALYLLVVLDNIPWVFADIESFSAEKLLGDSPGVPITLLDLEYATQRLMVPWAWIDYFKQRAVAIRDRYRSIAHDEEDFLAFYALTGRCANSGSHDDIFLHIAGPHQFTRPKSDIYSFLNVGPNVRSIMKCIAVDQMPHWTKVMGLLLRSRFVLETRLKDRLPKMPSLGYAILAFDEPDETDSLAIVPYRGVPLRELEILIKLKLHPKQQRPRCWVVYYDFEVPRCSLRTIVLEGQG